MVDKISRSLNGNLHIHQFLKHYLAFPHPPRYAVMLAGPWGIGKTFLVKKFLDEYFSQNRDQYVYVSLFGLNSIDDIDEVLLAAIYPKLSSKPMKIAGRVIKTLLKYKGIQTDIAPSDFLSKFKGKLYVFDDLERCDVPVNKVLGYINEFVEHDDCKVIIIANECEIQGGDEYRRRREKLIGRTLEVRSSFNEALTYFILQIDDLDTKEFFRRKSEEISSINSQSELQNLRIIQQTMWDFERVYKVLEERHRNNEVAMVALLQMFFALSLEFKSGRIELSDLETRSTGIVAEMKSLENDVYTRMAKADKRYAGIVLGDPILSNEVVVNILARGIVNQEEIRECLDRSSHFVTPETEPAWRTVWYSYQRPENEFQRALEEMEQEFLARKFLVPGEILHVFGLRLWMADIGALPKRREDVVQEGKAYVDDLYDKGALESLIQPNMDEVRFNGYGGLGINESETPEYRELCAYLKDKRLRAEADKYPIYANSLLADLAAEPARFCRSVVYSNSGTGSYYNRPVLAAIEPNTFVQAALKHVPAHQLEIFATFKSRYETGQLKRALMPEIDWLRSVRDALRRAVADMPPMSKFRGEKIIQWYIDPFVEDVENNDGSLTG